MLPYRRWHIKMHENIYILTNILLKFVAEVQINNTPGLVQIKAWRRPGDKPLSEPMMVSLLTHVCVTQPQWFITKTEQLFHWLLKRHHKIWSILFRFCTKPNWTNPRLLLVGPSRSHFCDIGIKYKYNLPRKWFWRCTVFWPYLTACVNQTGDLESYKAKVTDVRWGFTLWIGHILWYIKTLFFIYIIFDSQIVFYFCQEPLYPLIPQM